MEGIKLKKFSGNQEDYLVWRREFNAAMILKDLEHIISVKKNPQGNQPPKIKLNQFGQNKRMLSVLHVERRVTIVESHSWPLKIY